MEIEADPTKLIKEGDYLENLLNNMLNNDDLSDELQDDSTIVTTVGISPLEFADQDGNS